MPRIDCDQLKGLYVIIHKTRKNTKKFTTVCKHKIKLNYLLWDQAIYLFQYENLHVCAHVAVELYNMS